MTKKENKSDFEKDLDEIGEDISGVFEGLGDSLGALFGKEDKTRGTVNGLLKLSSSAIKLTWGVGSLAVKNTPKAIVAVAEVRRGISEAIVETYEEIQREEKEKEFDDKFKKKMEQIKLKQQAQSPVLGYTVEDRNISLEEAKAVTAAMFDESLAQAVERGSRESGRLISLAFSNWEVDDVPPKAEAVTANFSSHSVAELVRLSSRESGKVVALMLEGWDDLEDEVTKPKAIK